MTPDASPARVVRASDVGLALALAAFAAGLALRPMDETDLFFRLAMGEQFLRTGQLVHHNLFSFTYPAHPYLDSAWLFDVGAALLQRAGGFPAVVIAKALLLAGLFAGAFVVCRRRGAGPVAAGATLALAALVMSDRFVERPHLFSFAGVVLLLAVLQAAEQRPRLLLVLLPITALWANLHAGAFLAPLLLAAAALGLALDARAARRASAAPVGPSWAAVLGLALAATGAMLLTPVGIGLFRYLAFHLGIHAIHPVDEFRPPSWLSDAPLLLFAAATGVLALLVRGPPPVRWRDLLPTLVLAGLAARSVRFGAEFVLLAAPILAQRLTLLATLVARRWPVAAVPARPAALAPVVVALLLLATVLPRVVAFRAGRSLIAVDLARDALPLAALRFVEDNGLRGRMYNDFELGGYLAWTGAGRYPVFTDPRLPAYPREFHQVMGRGDLGRAEWDALMDRHGVDSALLGHAGINPRVAWWDPERWALLYRQQDARVFVRRLPRFRPLIARHEQPASFSFTARAGAVTVPLDRPPAASPVPACEWDLRLGDLYFDVDDRRPHRALAAYQRALAAPDDCLAPGRAASAASWVGALLLGRGDLPGALAAFDRAVASGGADTDLLTNRALALEALGRRSEAGHAWERVLAAAPAGPLADRARARAALLRATPP